jgi:carboxylate-amine ligase
MKDFYWDIRPKPEYGTVEIRVCDTPLSIETAVALAAYAQTLAKYYFDRPDLSPNQDIYLTYTYNRFQACRFGLTGRLIDPVSGIQATVREDILRTFEIVAATSQQLGTGDAIDFLHKRVANSQSDADWLRSQYQESGSLNDVVRQQSGLWMQTNER